MTYEGNTSFIATEDAVRSSKTSAHVIGHYLSHRRTLQSEFPECCQLDIVSCIHFLTYSGNIVREISLTSTCIREKILSFSFFWDVMQRRLVASYRRFGMLYRSNFLGSNSSWAAWSLNIRLLAFLEKSVCNYNFRIRNILEEKIP